MPDSSWGEEAWSDEDDNKNDRAAEDDQEAPFQDNDDGFDNKGEERSPSPFSQEGDNKSQASSSSTLPWYRRRKFLLIALLVLLLLVGAIIAIIMIMKNKGNDDKNTADKSNAPDNNNNSDKDVFADKTTPAPSSSTKTPTMAPSSSSETASPTTSTNDAPSATTTPANDSEATAAPTPLSTSINNTAVPTKTAAPTHSLAPSSNTTFQPTLAPSDDSSNSTASPTFSNATAVPVATPTMAPTATLTSAPTIFNLSLFTSWEPFGQTLQGNETNQQFGSTMDLDHNGRILAVQGNMDDTVSQQVRAWQYNGDHWQVMGGAFSGMSLGNLATNDNGQALLALRSQGSVQFYLYNKEVQDWEMLGNEIVEGEGSSGDVVVAISANGQRAVTATSTLDSSAGASSGRARVFQWTESSGSWEQIGQDLLGEVENDRFGTAVTISADGNTIAVSASFSNNGGYTQVEQAGYVKIFRFNQNAPSSSSWDKMQTLNGREVNSSMGLEVALSADGNTLTARKRDIVHVFQYSVTFSGQAGWVRLGQDLTPSELCDGWGGHLDLSANGRILAINVEGCRLCSDSEACPKYIGSVAIYGLMEEGEEPKWEQLGDYLRLADDSSHSLSLAGNGRSVAIGALNTDTFLSGVTYLDAGSVAVYGAAG